MGVQILNWPTNEIDWLNIISMLVNVLLFLTAIVAVVQSKKNLKVSMEALKESEKQRLLSTAPLLILNYKNNQMLYKERGTLKIIEGPHIFIKNVGNGIAKNIDIFLEIDYMSLRDGEKVIDKELDSYRKCNNIELKYSYSLLSINSETEIQFYLLSRTFQVLVNKLYNHIGNLKVNFGTYSFKISSTWLDIYNNKYISTSYIDIELKVTSESKKYLCNIKEVDYDLKTPDIDNEKIRKMK